MADNRVSERAFCLLSETAKNFKHLILLKDIVYVFVHAWPVC